MNDLRIGSLFSGIGGLELGLERAGLGRVVWQAEIDPWCRGVLARHWPDARRYADVRDVQTESAERVDVLCAGFPCQPVSQAGKRRGESDHRWLWPEVVRIIREAEPSIAVLENVPGLRANGLRRVLADLASLGMDAWWTTLGAADVGAPHRRNRLFIVSAHSDRLALGDVAEWIEARRIEIQRSREAESRDDGGSSNDSPSNGDGDGDGRESVAATRLHDHGEPWDDATRCARPDYGPAIRRWERVRGPAPEPALRRVDDGLRRGLVDLDERLRALGNAVVPQCSELIGRGIVHALSARERQ